MTYNGAELEARKNLAATIDTPVEVLRRLSADPEAEVRCLVASNPNTPTDILQKLGEEFPESVTANPVFDFLALENPDSKFIKLLLARSSTTSEDILARFAKSQDEEILCAVAKNVATPIDILQKLANWFPVDERAQKAYPGSSIHACVAINPKAPPSLLKKLAAHKDNLVRQAVATNTNTSLKILDKLARDKELKARLAVAKNITTPASTLEQLAGDDNKNIRHAVLEHPNVSKTALEIIGFMEEKAGTPVHILWKLADDNRLHIRRLVANHPFTPTDVLEKLVKDQDNFIYQSLIRHPNTSSQILEAVSHNLVDDFHHSKKLSNTYTSYFEDLINHPYITSTALEVLEVLVEVQHWQVLDRIAQTITTPSNILKKIVECDCKSGDFYLLYFLVSHPNTPTETLENLFIMMNDKNQINLPNYQYKIVEHPNIPIYILERIATDESYIELRYKVAQNPSTPLDILRTLASDLDEDVLAGVAANINTPVDILEGFAVSQNDKIKMRLASNIKTPAHILEKLAYDEDESIRKYIARNIATPIPVLERLALDSSELVRSCITENPKTPANVLYTLVKSKEVKICNNIAKHPNASFKTLFKLAESNREIRFSLLERENLPITIIRKLLRISLNIIKYDESIHGYVYESSIIEKIVKHPDTPIAILERLALEKYPEIPQYSPRNASEKQKIIRAIASNIYTPTYILEEILRTSDEFVREIAKKTLKSKPLIN